MHDMVEGVAGSIVRGKFRHEKSPWGVVMNNMVVKRRGEHVVQPFADGTNWWLAWEVSPNMLLRWVGVNVPHHGGDHGVTMRVHVLHHGVTIGLGRGAQVVATGGLDLPGSDRKSVV